MLATGFFFAIDVIFFAANLPKFFQGGRFPLLLGGVIFTLMPTCGRGREMMLVEARSHTGRESLRHYLDRLSGSQTLWVPGTAMFLTIEPDVTRCSTTSSTTACCCWRWCKSASIRWRGRGFLRMPSLSIR